MKRVSARDAHAHDAARAGLADLPPEITRQIEWVFRSDSGYRVTGRFYELVKRLTDLLLIAATAPVWLPALGMCCLVTKIESPKAPVLFIQQRTGRNGRRFPMYKIRTMVSNAEALLPGLKHLNERKWPEIRLRNDPRATHFGRILRRTHLDELPQLFNVLRGNLSLVGPRPTSAPVEAYEPWHVERLGVVPGITGLWQLVQDDVNDFDEHMLLDIIYVRKRCWLLDLRILVRTAGIVLTRTWDQVRRGPPLP